MNKNTFCSRIYVYVTYDPEPTEQSFRVDIANASGTPLKSGFLDGPSEVSSCLSAMGCSDDRLPQVSRGDEVVRVLHNVRPRDLDAALALLD
ncbi:MAG: hypothetical protein JSS86_12075 [Cyanobacteria bacterium SZAS LIN-2]|nr:hypothetical protein [Cyanobacteria bacterium SZAS LIN-3]MBS1997047.1 hypothetical protein [Cyanobacteria bacterium SZAS LIN-2]